MKWKNKNKKDTNSILKGNTNGAVGTERMHTFQHLHQSQLQVHAVLKIQGDYRKSRGCATPTI